MRRWLYLLALTAFAFVLYGADPKPGEVKVKTDYAAGKSIPAEDSGCRPYENGGSVRRTSIARRACEPAKGSKCNAFWREVDASRLYSKPGCKDEDLASIAYVYGWVCQ